MTRAQARAIAECGPAMVLSDGAAITDWPGEFGRSAALGVEIGFGMGHELVDWARRQLDWNLVGIEVYQPGIGAALLGVERWGLNNVRVLAEDAQSAMTRHFQPGTIDEARIFFPDPWPKKRHHKRRLIQPEFASVIASRLRAGARLLLATDWQDYAQWMLEVLDNEPQLTNLAGTGRFSQRDETRVSTRFESRGRKLGHSVWDLAYVRNS